MSESKFTPGPWRVGSETSDGYFTVCAIRTDANPDRLTIPDLLPVAETVDRDNANLVSAAPDLYEALMAALKHILSEAEARNFDPPASPELVADIEAALAKAEGRS